MNDNAVSALLQVSVNPVYLTDSLGVILWASDTGKEFASKSFKNPPVKLDSILGSTNSLNILKVTHSGILSLIQEDSLSLAPYRSAIVISFPGASRGLDRYLITLQPLVSPIERLREREDVLSAISHDLRNPIGAIFGYADALLDTSIGSTLSPPQREIVARIRGTSSRSLDLVKNYQHIMSLHATPPVAPANKVDLNIVVQGVIESTWREDSASPSLMLSLSPNPPLLSVDRNSIERIVSNLYSNALKYTPKNETISIVTGVHEGRPFFRISNSGVTIPPQEIPTLFQNRTRASTSIGVSGSGLGLYIVKSTLDAVGGDVIVTSDASLGTTFTVMFHS